MQLFTSWLLLLIPATAVWADEMSTIYVVQSAPIPEGERELAEGGWVVKQPLLPLKLYELSAAIDLPEPHPKLVEGTGTLVDGSQMFGVQSQTANIACIVPSATANIQLKAFPCLMDRDRDGRFEALFWGMSVVDGLPIVAGPTPTKVAEIGTGPFLGSVPNGNMLGSGLGYTRRLYLLPNALPYREVDPATLKTPFFVGIQHRYDSDRANSPAYMRVVFGREGATSAVGTGISVRASDMPKSLQVMGANFTALSKHDRMMRVSVQSAMPTQPFSVQMQRAR